MPFRRVSWPPCRHVRREMGGESTLLTVPRPVACQRSGGTAGTVRVIALANIDIQVRHPESFAIIVDADTS